MYVPVGVAQNNFLSQVTGMRVTFEAARYESSIFSCFQVTPPSQGNLFKASVEGFYLRICLRSDPSNTVLLSFSPCSTSTTVTQHICSSKDTQEIPSFLVLDPRSNPATTTTDPFFQNEPLPMKPQSRSRPRELTSCHRAFSTAATRIRCRKKAFDPDGRSKSYACWLLTWLTYAGTSL